MAIICWGGLGKAANNTTTIDEEITEYIRLHDENINSHMGDGYSLGTHRLQNLLDHPYGSIRYWHVEDIHAEAITAGGMVIYGTGPYISVQDQAGAERVKIYPEGIIVKGGKISVENEGNKEIIDGKGLKGSNIFYSCEIQKTDVQNIPGDVSFYAITPLAFGFHFYRPTPVFFFGNITWSTSGKDSSLQVWLEYPGGYFPRGNGWVGEWPEADVFKRKSLSFHHIMLLSAGYSSVRVIGARQSPDETINVDGSNASTFAGYMVLGN